MTETEKAYLAGLIDGEGYIGVIRSKNNYWVTLQLEMADPEPVDLLARVLQANIRDTRKDSKDRKTLHKVVCGGKRAQALLTEILPYIRGKQIIAELVLGFPIGRVGHQLTNDDFEKQERLYYELKELNRRGRL